jgi:hypothetical protein
MHHRVELERRRVDEQNIAVIDSRGQRLQRRQR